MIIYLHPDLVAAAIAFLPADKMRQLERLLADVDDEEEFVLRTTEFLLREVGPEKIHRQWQSYKSALADSLAHATKNGGAQ